MKKIILLVFISDEGKGNGKGKAVFISVAANDFEVSVNPQAIIPGQVAKVTVVHDETNKDEVLTITVNGERNGIKQTETITIIMETEKRHSMA